MQYFIFPVLMILYFELLGRWVMYKFGKEPLDFSFVIGFLAIMAVYYVIAWPITALNQSFYLFVGLSLILFLGSIIPIIKDIKNLSFKFDLKMVILFILFVGFEVFISWNRTLGDPHGFDALYYVNMISFNIGNNAMNTLHPHFGTYPNTDVQWITYVFQSFYYFVPTVIYLIRSGLSLIDLFFETLPAYVWGFQIFAHSLFVGTSLMCVKEIKTDNKVLKLALVILLVLFMGNFYYNNCFGFIGNNYRMSIHAIATLFLFRYFKNNDKNYIYLFYLSMLGMCAVSSTGTFSFVFVLFGLFFVLYNKERNILKEYAVVLAIPLLNIVVTKFGINLLIVLLVFSICIFVFVLNDHILNLYQNKYIRYGTLILLFLVLYVASVLLSHKLFEINRFLNNYSEFQDMSWDYFWFYDLRHWIFNLLVLIPYTWFLIKNPKNPLSVISFVLIFTFFNPLCSEFINKINWVYYRSYDILINQYTLVLFVTYLYNSLYNISLKRVFSITVLIMSLILASIQIPRYYHESFIPNENYSNIYKIDSSELEVIYNVRRLIKDKKIEKPAIITSTFWMPSFIEDSTYLIGKERRYNYDQYNDNSYALYLIFYPTDGWDNFRPTDQPDYDNVIGLLKESEYNILVVDYGLYADYKGQYISLADAVESDGTYIRSEYSTSKYAVFYLGDK